MNGPAVLFDGVIVVVGDDVEVVAMSSSRSRE